MMIASDRSALERPSQNQEKNGESYQEILEGLAYVDLLVRWAVVRARAHGLDPNDEFRGLYISEDQIDNLLGYELGSLWPAANGQLAGMEEWPVAIAQQKTQWLSRLEERYQSGLFSPIGHLCHVFGLSPDELDIIMITLAPEIDPRYERIYAYLQDDVTKKRPSINLILNLIADSFETKLQKRRLFTDEGLLIDSRLLIRFIDGGQEPPLLGQYLRPAQRLVEHILGQAGLDDRLNGSARLSFPNRSTPWLPAELLERLAGSIEEPIPSKLPPLFAFEGGYGVGKKSAANHLAMSRNKPLIIANLNTLADMEVGLREGISLVLRDGRLLHAVIYLGGWDSLLIDGQPPADIMSQLLEYPEVIALGGEEAWQPIGERISRRILRVPFTTGDYEHRLNMWLHYLADSDSTLADNDHLLTQLANQFLFSSGQIGDVVATARDLAEWRGEPLGIQDLFAASRAHSNQKLMSLATKITPRYRWEDIVLPHDTLAQLQEMVNRVRQRPLVYGKWGFDRKVALGKGLSALFAGESGTGKTMAADIIAGELGQDLYKIDLSMLVSKYIGETEKNLNRVFSEAETSNAILFFDEADAIFGKRSEVKDSHDRYANIEISYLLQRMETYDGVVILASNLRGNLDEAFTRRLHFIVEFPFPEAADREIIWKVNFPPETPVSDDVDFRLLARRFRITGGNIRNIIMASAFLAAESDEPVGMPQLLHGARREFQKIGRLIDEELFVLGD